MKTFLRNALHSTQSLLEKMERLLADKVQDVPAPQEKSPGNVALDTQQQIKLPLPVCEKQKSVESTAKDRVFMNTLLRDWSIASGNDLKELKAQLRKNAGVRRIDYMTVAQVEDACEWIKENIAREKQGS